MNQNQLEIRFNEDSDFRIVVEKKSGLELPKITIESKNKSFVISSTETPNIISKQEHLKMDNIIKKAGIKVLAMKTFFSETDPRKRDNEFVKIMKGFKPKTNQHNDNH